MRAFVILVVAGLTLGRPTQGTDRRQDNVALQNGKDAIAANQRFKALSADSPCQDGESACIKDDFALCEGGRFVIQPCGAGTICAALPSVTSAGLSNTCTTPADRDARIAATGANATGANATDASVDDAQTSLTLDPAVIATNFTSDGLAQSTPGQAGSLTSSNNFINFCRTVNKEITNGRQIPEGSCNPAPMGVIAAKNRIPSCKFEFPANGATIQAGQPFTVRLAVKNLVTGYFTNAQQNFFSAPQQVDGDGFIRGHSHVVIERLESLDQTTPLNPEDFVFFKALNNPDVDGVLSTEFADGLTPGFYKFSSINTASNHQPVLVAVAQHGSVDDAVYITVA